MALNNMEIIHQNVKKFDNMETICNMYFDEFCKKIEEHYIHIDKSILPSEMFLVCCLNKYFGTTLVLESGIAYGSSTRMLAEYLPECKIKSVDDARLYGDQVLNDVKEKLSVYNNLEIYKGNGIDFVSEWAAENPNETISVLLDGPKSNPASQLANKLLDTHKNIKFVAVHDQPTYSHTLDNYNKKRDRIYSEDLSKFNFINDLNLKNDAPMFPGHMTLKERMVRVRMDRSKGGEGYPGLGVVFNDPIPENIEDKRITKDKISVVASSFGTDCDPYIGSLKNSVKAIYPDMKINVVGKDVPTDEDRINKLREEIEFVRISPGSLKIICWNQGFKEADSEWVLFMDNDTALIQSIDHYFPLIENSKADFIFTWRHSNPQWINSGVMLVRKNEKTLKFFEDYETKMIEDVKNNHNDQHTFISLLNRDEKFVENILNSKRDDCFKFDERGIRFLTVHCDYLNRSNPKADWFDGTCIQHFKGIQCTIITKNPKGNRYNAFINGGIFGLDPKSLKNLNYRINLWKKFADEEYSKDVIDIEEFVKNKRG